VINRNLPVRVFMNLKYGCYSIMQKGVIRASAKQVRLEHVTFRVREAGRLRMLREQRRNVHAFAVGRLLDYVHPSEARELESMSGRGVYYNPHEAGAFLDCDTRTPVPSAGLVQFNEHGVVYADTREAA